MARWVAGPRTLHVWKQTHLTRIRNRVAWHFLNSENATVGFRLPLSLGEGWGEGRSYGKIETEVGIPPPSAPTLSQKGKGMKTVSIGYLITLHDPTRSKPVFNPESSVISKYCL